MLNGFSWDPEIMEFIRGEVVDSSALDADEVVMRGDIGVEAEAFLSEADSGNETVFGEEFEVTVDGVE